MADRVSTHAHLNALQAFQAERLVQQVSKAYLAAPDAILAGLPVIAKDNINTTTFPASGGTKALLSHTPAKDAGVVRKITGAGGVIGGKATMHEPAFGITSNNAVTGAVRNPVDPKMIPGGFSGGTAAAVAAGIFPLGLGTDTGRSCRIPAALCGVVGFRSSTGWYDSDGIIPISHTRDTAGPIARSVRDIILMDDVLSGQTSSPVEVDLSQVTLGVPNQVFFEDLDPLVEAAVEAQLSVLTRAGVRLVEVDLGDIWLHNAAFSAPVVLHEVMQDLPAYLAQHAPGISLETLVEGIGSPDVAGAIGSQLGSDAMPKDAYISALNTHRPG